MTRQFVRFSMVGVAGFLVDASLITLLTNYGGINPLLARLASFLAAATTTWWLNRRFTFAAKDTSLVRQWLRFMAAMSIGGGVNYAVFTCLVLMLPLVMRQPWTGVAAGSLAGLAVNYYTSRRYVF